MNWPRSGPHGSGLTILTQLTVWPPRFFGFMAALIVTIAIRSDATAADAGIAPLGQTQIDLASLKRHVATLASDSLEGREAGSRGGKAALAYLRSELTSLRQSRRIPREEVQDFGREYQNLLLMLPGSDERLRNEVIVVGAHYDHVGYGNASNSKGPLGQVHNGADDNASGAAALLELIKAFGSLPTPPARSIQFAFWDAEEVGLLGSKHWVAHPTVPLRTVKFALNLDMLGRLRNGHVLTSGWRSAAGLRLLLARQNVTNELQLAFQPRVLSDSDHYSFYAAGIPIIHIDTDKHDDYHRPSDDVDKVNWAGLHLLTTFAYRVVTELANQPESLRFRSDALKEAAPQWMTPSEVRPAPVRLGVNWNLELAKKNIVEVQHVTPDSPAARSGIRAGDRILKVGVWEEGSLVDLKTTVQLVKSPVTVRLVRSGASEPIDVTVNLWGEATRLGVGWVEDPAMPNCVVVTHVISDSPANRAGIASGDIILEMGGQPISSSDQLRQRVIAESGPFQFRIERLGRIGTVTVDILDQPTARGRTAPVR